MGIVLKEEEEKEFVIILKYLFILELKMFNIFK